MRGSKSGECDQHLYNGSLHDSDRGLIFDSQYQIIELRGLNDCGAIA